MGKYMKLFLILIFFSANFCLASDHGREFIEIGHDITPKGAVIKAARYLFTNANSSLAPSLCHIVTINKLTGEILVLKEPQSDNDVIIYEKLKELAKDYQFSGKTKLKVINLYPVEEAPGCRCAVQ